MNYLVKVGDKEVIVKPYLIKSIIDDIIIFDYMYSLNEYDKDLHPLALRRSREPAPLRSSVPLESFNYNIIKNVKGLFIKFI